MRPANRALFTIVFLMSLVLGLLPSVSFAASDDWDIPGGHFFTQTGGGGGLGYAVTDEGGILFWSAFQRFGGVQAVGYPASQRFQWDGFTVQVFQRVVFQWHPDTGTVAFVNTFDRLHDLGKDDWLYTMRQVPRPIQLDEQGKTWDQIVAGRLALLDAAPAIKAKYYDVVGDPIQANGLPTSAVTDMGNHLALRAQRVEFQLWKQDVPWAKAGTVTVALGGDIVKEAGILPDQGALEPTTAPGGQAPAQPSPTPNNPAPAQSSLGPGAPPTIQQPVQTGSCSGNVATLVVDDETAYPLSLSLNGPSSQALTLDPGASTNLQLPPGSYKVTGSMPVPDVPPFSGTWNLSNCPYNSTFFLIQ